MSFKRFQRAVEVGSLEAAQRLAANAERGAKRKVSGEVLNIRTGDLYSSIHGRARLAGPSKAVALLELSGPGEKHGRIWEQTGVRRHFVSPRRAKALSWIDERTGRRLFSKGHWIPAQAKRPFMRPALQEAIPATESPWVNKILGALEALFSREIRIKL